MPYRRKDSPVWWATYTDASGKRVRRSTGTENRKEAEALEAKWKLEAFRQQHWDELPERSFDEVMLPFLKVSSDKRSIDDICMHIRRLRGHFHGHSMNQLSGQHVRDYIHRRKDDGVSNATVNRELEVLSAAINHANAELDWGLPNPVRGRHLEEPEGRVRWLTRSEAASLLQAAETALKAPHLVDFIVLALHTGMRRSEILGLEWRRIDLAANLLHLQSEHTKSKRRRSVPINRTARGSILRRARFRAEHCPDSPWLFCNQDGERIADVKRSFATACRRAGIEDFRIHDLRHTCAAWLVSDGVPLPEVRDLLGHSTVKVTERYAHLSPDNVRSAVERLDQESVTIWSRWGERGRENVV